MEEEERSASTGTFCAYAAAARNPCIQPLPGWAYLFPLNIISLCCDCRKFCCDQIFIGRSLFQFARAFQNILEKVEAALLKYQIALPCVLVIIAGYYGSNSLQIGLRELRLNDGGNFFRRVGLHIVHTFLKSICKALYDIRVLVDITLFCAEGGIRNIAAVFAKGGHYIAFPFGLKGGRARLKLD